MYNYETERKELFTDDGQRMFIKVRDNVKHLLATAGAVRMENAIAGVGGSSWTLMACVDRMVELGELREVTLVGDVCGQDRVFVSAVYRD